MKNVSVLFLLVVFIFSSIAQVAAQEPPILGPDLVINGNFDDNDEDGIPDGWYPFFRGGSSVVIDSTIFAPGSTKSLLIHKVGDETPLNTAAGVEQNISINGGVTYQFKIKMKMQQIRGNTDYLFYVNTTFFEGGAWVSPGLGEKNAIRPLEQTDDFTEYVADLTVPARAATCVVDLGLYSASKDYEAKVWIDSFSVRKLYSKPLIPPQVQATRLKNGQVKLTWQVEKNAEGDQPIRFEVYRSTDPLEEGTKVGANLEGSTWTDTTLSTANRERYYYRLKAYDVMNRFSVSEVAIALGLASLSGVVTTSDGKSPAGTVLTLFMQEESIGEITIGDDGTFSFPNLIEGTYKLSLRKPTYQVLRSDDIELQAEAEETRSLELIFSDDPPNSPENVIALTPDPGLVMLSWVAPTGGEEIDFYQVYRQEGDTSDFNKAMLIATDIKTTSYKDTHVQGEKTYIYFVISISLAEIPSVPAASAPVTVVIPPLVQLIQPVDGEVLIDLMPSFEWEQLAGTDYYTLELSKDKNFAQGKVIRYESVSNNNYQLPTNLGEGTWYWRVQPTFSTGVVGSFNEPETFVVVISNPVLGGAGMIKLDQQHFAPRKGEIVLGRYVLDKDSEVSLKLYSTNGKCVRILLNLELKDSGAHSFQWDGKNQQGEYVPNGLYFIELFVKAAANKPIRAVGRVLVLN